MERSGAESGLCQAMKAADARGDRYEIHDGEVVVVENNASPMHQALSRALLRALNARLPASCLAASEQAVQLAAEGVDTRRPDLLVVCGQERQGRYGLLNPTAIIEILSPSSLHDLTTKADAYAAISSVVGYVVVSQDEPRAYVHRERASGLFSPIVIHRGGWVEIPGTGASIDVDALFEQARAALADPVE